MRVCFLTNGPIKWASARYRGFWVAECREDWSAYELEKLTALPDADVYVFAKSFDTRLVKEILNQGKRVFWDLCDPLHWFSPDETREMAMLVDGIVCSNAGLNEDLHQWLWQENDPKTMPKPPFIHTIPDRLKLSHYDKQRQHADVSPVRFIWFGAAQNRAVLYPGFVTLSRLKANGYDVELTIMDDRPDMPLYYGPDCPVYFQRWSLDTEVEVIANHDIALLPDYPGEWGKVKSNNKQLTAWACGLPTLSESDDYQWAEWLMDWEYRKKTVTTFPNIHSIEKSAQDWETLLNANGRIDKLQQAKVLKARA